MQFMHVHSATHRACSRLGGPGGMPPPAEDFLRIYPSKVKSGVNLDQKLLD